MGGRYNERVPSREDATLATEPAIPVSAINRRLVEIERELAKVQALEIEKAMLERLRDQAVASNHGHGGTGRRRRGRPPAKGEPVTKRIIQLVEDQPHITKDAVVERLESVVETSTGEPRRIILTTISNLISRQRLAQDGRGGLVKAEAVRE